VKDLELPSNLAELLQVVLHARLLARLAALLRRVLQELRADGQAGRLLLAAQAEEEQALLVVPEVWSSPA
jgi:hypothetical protein